VVKVVFLMGNLLVVHIAVISERSEPDQTSVNTVLAAIFSSDMRLTRPGFRQFRKATLQAKS